MLLLHTRKIRKKGKAKKYLGNFNKTLTFGKKKGIEPIFYGTTPIEFIPLLNSHLRLLNLHLLNLFILVQYIYYFIN